MIEKLNLELDEMGFGDSKENQKIAKGSVDLFFNSIKNALASGDRVEIRGLGSFSMKHYEGYVGRNPKTGKKVEVEPKRLPVFKPGKDLKRKVNSE
ncbi:MAG: integration host factor subunit beta [bacterium]|jgi:integration host factor subunit beta